MSLSNLKLEDVSPATAEKASSLSADSGVRFRFLVGLGAAAIMMAVMAYPLWTGSVYTFNDLGDYHLPLRSFYARCLATGNSFTWMPDIFCGYYIHGEGQVGMFHPLHLVLYKTLPLGIAFNLELLLSYPFMLAGIFLFLRRWKLPRDASIFGGIIFTFSGFNLLHFMHLHAIAVAAHIPWMLWAVDVVVREQKAGRAAFGTFWLALLIVSQFLLGFPQFVWFSLVFEVLYAALIFPLRVNGWRIISLGIATVLSPLAACVQLLPSYDVFLHSVRKAPTLDFLFWRSLHPVNLFQFVAPYFYKGYVFGDNTHELSVYTGAISLILLVYVLLRLKDLGELRPLATGALGFGALGLVLSLGRYGFLYSLFLYVPVVGLFRSPSRYILLLHFSVAILSAIAFTDLARLIQRREYIGWRKLWPLGVIPLAALLPIGLAIWALICHNPALIHYFVLSASSAGHIWAGPIIFACAIIPVVMAARGRRAALVGILLLAALDQGVYGFGYMFSTRPTDIESYVDSVPKPPKVTGFRLQSGTNVLTMAGFKLTGGYVALKPKRVLDDDNPANLKISGVRWIWRKPEPLSGVYVSSRLPDPLPRDW